MTASTQNKPPEQQFRMRIEEVRSIPGRGTLVTGPIEQGAVAAGDGVEIVGSGAKPIASVVTAVFVSGKVSERGHAGDTVGVLLRAVDPNQVTRGQVLRAVQFRMRIEEVRSIPGRGTLVTGPIEQGAVAAGDGVEIVGSGAKPIASVVTAVFVSGKVSERGHAGDTVGVLLRAVDPNQVTRGQVLRAS